MNLKKRVLSVATAIICASGVFSLTVNGAVYSNQMSYNNDYLGYNKIDEDEDGTFDFIEVRGCNSDIKNIVIPDEIDGLPVKSIGYRAFYNYVNLISVDIPDGVTSIDNSAFDGCVSLTDIKLPESVTSIGISAFSSCKSLTSIDIPESVTSIRISAFSNCTSLKSINLPDSITKIEDAAFFMCGNLKSIRIPDSVISIGDNVFDYCDNLSIFGYDNSFAQVYAEENNIVFELLDNKTPILGDANKDWILNIRDAAYIAIMLAKGMGDKLPECADFNEDGRVNIRDAASISIYFAKINK